MCLECLADGEGVLAIFKQMPDLRVLYCQGNPFVKELRNYRKRMISEIKTLRYLDDRPVFEDERLTVEAWLIRRLPAERAERRPEAYDHAGAARWGGRCP